MIPDDSAAADPAAASQEPGSPDAPRRRRRSRRSKRPATETADAGPEAAAFLEPPPVGEEAAASAGAPKARSRRRRKSGRRGASTGEAEDTKDADAGTGRKRRSRRRRRPRGEGTAIESEPDVEAPLPAGDDEAKPTARTRTKAKAKAKAKAEPSGRKRRTREPKRGRERKPRERTRVGRKRDPRAIDIVPQADYVTDPSVEKILLVNAEDRDEARIALLVDGRLEEVYIEAAKDRSAAGNIYRGRIQNVEKGIGAAFVDLGRGTTGFLHASDMPLKEDESTSDPITERMHPGDEVIVQITRDGVGRKGPALTGRISLPGRYLVLMPYTDRSGISRRIPQGSERERMRKLLRKLELPEGMGVILRTASETTDGPALRGDLDHLLAEWAKIQRKAAEPGPPELLRTESDLAERSVRDIMPSSVTRIVVDKEETVGKIHQLLRTWYPSAHAAADAVAHAAVRAATAAAETPLGEIEAAARRKEETPEGQPFATGLVDETWIEEVTDEENGESGMPPEEGAETEAERQARMAAAIPEVLLHTDPMPLFHAYDVETQLEDAFRRQMRLPSGGSIVIDPTEALIAIDVNSGRLTGEEDPESTALVTNLEAVPEIARQLRLRDRGGLVVIDFIDMRESRSRREVESALREGLSRDRARIRLGRMGPFGCVILSRQRIRQALTRITHDECVACHGTGRLRNAVGLGLRVLREMQARVARSRGRGGLEIRAPRAVIEWIKRYRPGELRRLRSACSGPITLEEDARLASDGWAMKGLAPASKADAEPEPGSSEASDEEA